MISKFDHQNDTGIIPQSFFQLPAQTLSLSPLLSRWFHTEQIPHPYVEYDPLKNYSTQRCASIVAYYVSMRGSSLRTKNKWKSCLQDYLGICPIEYPSPFFLNDISFRAFHSVRRISETVKKGERGAHLHLVVQLSNSFDGKEDINCWHAASS